MFFAIIFLLLFSSPQFVNPEMVGSYEVVEQVPEETVAEPVEPPLEIDEDLKIAYLTFDDGPTVFLADILAILAEYEVKATFFMLEPQMWSHQEVLKDLAAAGHGLGLHGVSHNYKQFYASPESAREEMNTAQATLETITGVRTVLVRTPYGSSPYLKPAHREILEMEGFKIWDWNVDSRDWFYRDQRMVEDTLQQLAALEQKNEVPVILLHERSETVKFLPQILEYLLAHDYSLQVPDEETVPVQFTH